jgi:hypothetical protein
MSQTKGSFSSSLHSTNGRHYYLLLSVKPADGSTSNVDQA